MTAIRRLTAALALGAALLPAGCSDDDRQDIETWHAARVERLRADDGWLTLVGLHPLAEGVHDLGSAPDADLRLPEAAPARVGLLAVEDGTVHFAVVGDLDVVVHGDPDAGPVGHLQLRHDADGDPTVLAVGSFLFHVIERGDELFLRVKDRESEVLRTFTGVDRFPVDERWRIRARLERGGDGVVEVPDVLGHVNEAPSPGTLVFDLDGTSCRLTPMGEPGDHLFIVFGDATNGETTYGGGRFLEVDPIGDDGEVVLDFNRAVNPPCVFTPFATCTLPPARNVLSVAVEAGERMWGTTH